MSRARRRYLLSLAAMVAAGLLIGWLYGAPLAGLAVGSLAALARQTWQLFRFDQAVSERREDRFGFGENIWTELLARMDYQRQRARRHKRRHRRLLREVRQSTNAMPDGGIVLNRDFEIVLANASAERYAGVRMPQDRGQCVDNIIRDPRFVAYLRNGDYSRALEIRSPRTVGAWLSCRIVPFGAGQRLLLIRDITEVMRVNRMRRDFVANASHELRTPLTVISGYLDGLVDDPALPAEWQQPLQQMQAQAGRMERVVAELLELSKLESDADRRDEEYIDMAALFEQLQRRFSGSGEGPRIEFEQPWAARLVGVSTEIETVTGNLLSNALRHTPADGRIRVSWRPADDGGGLLEVEDSGEGIAPEHLPRLTERFFRVDDGRSRDAGGIGLGLAIVKHALLRHDAELEIRSQPGEGSLFRCRFPAARIRPAAATESAGKAESGL